MVLIADLGDLPIILCHEKVPCMHGVKFQIHILSCPCEQPAGDFLPVIWDFELVQFELVA